MKKLVVFILLITGLVACKKDKVSKDDPILGSWTLVKIANGLMGMQTVAEWGHTKSCTFKSDNTCSVTFDGTTTASKYVIKTGYSQIQQKDVTFAYIDNTEYIVSYLHDTLSLSNKPEVDGPIEFYVKK